MTFTEKLESWTSAEIWEEYCGFLNLSLDEYMQLQERLLLEQIELLKDCALGQRFFKGKTPASLKEFRRIVPLTRYHDYADILLEKRADMLPAQPVTWCHTTWTGGEMPEKVVPYTESMIEAIKTNMVAVMIFATSREKGSYRIKKGANSFQMAAPPPFTSALMAQLVEDEVDLDYLLSRPELKELSLAKKIKAGLNYGIKQNISQVVGVASILTHVGEQMQSLSGGGFRLSRLMGMSIRRIMKLRAAKRRCRQENRGLLPKDVFDLDAIAYSIANSHHYKERIEAMWGLRPLEFMTETESSCTATETWTKDGLVFFPDVNFYEFIPEADSIECLKKPKFMPHVFLIDEIEPDQKYELVITSFKGGAFLRYRTGQIFLCVKIKNQLEGIDFPQFKYVDRTPDVINVGEFTRITEKELSMILARSGLPIIDWFAKKDSDRNGTFLHIFLEMKQTLDKMIDTKVLSDHLAIYLRYWDSDFKHLKEMLELEPLRVTLLQTGAMQKYADVYGEPVTKFNPDATEFADFMRINDELTNEGRLSYAN